MELVHTANPRKLAVCTQAGSKIGSYPHPRFMENSLNSIEHKRLNYKRVLKIFQHAPRKQEDIHSKYETDFFKNELIQ